MEEIKQLNYHHLGRDNLNDKSHFHEYEFEILHILSGEGTMMIKDKLYDLVPDTVFFICGKDAHYSSPVNPKVYMRNKIIFSRNLLVEICNKLNCTNITDELFMQGGCAIKLSSDSSVQIDEFFLKLYESAKKDSCALGLSFCINVFSIIDTAVKNRRKAVPCIKNKISDVIEYITRNTDKKLSLDDIAQNTNISKYYLSHLFKNTVGMTVFEYIQFIRISKAKKLLMETEDSILAVSSAVGFGDSAYFTKVFRQMESMTPGQYRRAVRQKQ